MTVQFRAVFGLCGVCIGNTEPEVEHVQGMMIGMCKRFKTDILALTWAFMTLLVLVAAPGSAQETATETTEDASVEAPAEPQGPDESDIVATIGQKVLTVQELARDFANRGTNFGPDLALAQQRLRDTVIAEYWVDQNFANLAVRDRRTARALGEARRQVLFEIYAQSTFTREEVAEEDIEAYVETNRSIFDDRRSYVYQRALVVAQDEAQFDAVRRALEGLSEIGNAPSDFTPFTSRLVETGVNFAVTRQWTSDENLTPDLQQRLRAMSDQDQRVDIIDTAPGFDVLILIDSYDDPVDPTQLREQIVSQIQQERYITHRLNLAQSIAEPLIGALPEPLEEVEFKPTVPILAASAIAGVIFGLVMAMLISWNRTTRVAAEVMEKASLGDFSPSLRNHPIFVRLVVIVLFLALLAEIFLGFLFGPLWLRTLEVLAGFFGLLLLGLILGLLIWRTKDITDKNALGKLRWARQRSLLSSTVLLAGGAVVALRPGPVVRLVDYLWSTVI